MEKNKDNLFRSRRFLPLFITQFFGAFNDNAFKNAFLIWFTYDVTVYYGLNASIMLTLAGGIFILPFFLFSATAGQLADKYERSWLTRQIKLAEIILMLCCAVFFFCKSVSGLLVILFLMGVQSTFFGPIKYSLLPEHLDSKELISGNAWIEGGTFLSILLGTVFGGIIITLPFGIIFLVVFLIIFSIIGYGSACFIPKAQIQDDNLKINLNFMSETVNIIKYAKKERRVWFSILGISWFWLIGIIFLTLFPLYTVEIIVGNQHLVTFFMTIFSVGIGIGSVLCNWILKGNISTKLVPMASLGMSFAIVLFYISSMFYMENYETVKLIDGNGIGFVKFFAMNSWSFIIVFSILLLSVMGGIYIVPLYAVMQHFSDRKYVSRIIAGNNIINSLFMVFASVLCSVLLVSGISTVGVFLIVGILNFMVYIYMVNIMKRRKYND